MSCIVRAEPEKVKSRSKVIDKSILDRSFLENPLLAIASQADRTLYKKQREDHHLFFSVRQPAEYGLEISPGTFNYRAFQTLQLPCNHPLCLAMSCHLC
jgi:hypothetical protein